MDQSKAHKILSEYQLWRRGEPPYDYKEMEYSKQLEYSPKEISEALDYAVMTLEGETNADRSCVCPVKD